jgi:hypothetical protein
MIVIVVRLLEKSCRNVVVVVPQPYDGTRQIVLITKRTQAGWVEQKIPAAGSWAKSQPARGQDPNEVSTGEEQYVPADATDTLDHTIGPLTDLRR